MLSRSGRKAILSEAHQVNFGALRLGAEQYDSRLSFSRMGSVRETERMNSHT